MKAVMKTTISALLILILTIPVLGAMENPPRRMALEEEAYVDDIPFDTREVVLDLSTVLPEEEYVDDIPFNTLDVVLFSGIVTEEENSTDDSVYPSGKVFALQGIHLEEEAYIHDIPFNTLDVITLGQVTLPAEENVNDIPFDTGCIVRALHKEKSSWARCMLQLDGNAMESQLGFGERLMVSF